MGTHLGTIEASVGGQIEICLMASQEILRDLPSVDKILSSLDCQTLIQRYGHARCTNEIRQTLDSLRSDIANEKVTKVPNLGKLIVTIEDRLRRSEKSNLVRVLNLTGTVLHTNLGRAMLPENAINAIAEVAENASNLEFDIGHGKRGDRDDHVAALISELTGAEAATIVNNNAAAVLLTLNTLAASKEVCISRGELVEIGGSFRIPEVMEKSGSLLVEVGSTNRTHKQDYENAITKDTGLLLKVHTSNYEIKGFTSDVSYGELAELAQSKGIPLLADLGSGTLVNLENYELPHEPTVQEIIATGVDLVTFSGDKLLGGPQAGIIAGREDLIAQIKSNPLKRALRVDKMTVAALVEVLKLFRQPEKLIEVHPTIRHLARQQKEITAIANELLQPLQEVMKNIASVKTVVSNSQIGSGALPIDRLPSRALQITPIENSDRSLQQIVHAFRNLPVPVIGRIQSGKLLFDLRTLDDSAIFIAQLEYLKLT